MNNRNHLSDILDVNEIIQSTKRKFCIISGVGSGKNYFVEHKLRNAGNILYISSRRAKVDEILTNKACNEKINWDNEFNDIVSTTNYGIEMMVKNEKFCITGIRDTMAHFEYIVVDEAHSLYTDATYTDSSFHVIKLLEYAEKNFPKIKIILMTGTPEPMEILLKQGDYEIIDKRDECINVMPKRIVIIPFETAIRYMRNLPDEEKTIYYSNSAQNLVKGENSMFKKLLKSDESEADGSGINEAEIAFCMSENSIAKLKKYRNTLGEECRALKSYVTENNRLPDDKRILLTTSTLKEGINILENDIKIAFCESHVLSDIQQFAGRVRNGLDTLYIIDNRKQFIKSDEEMHLAQMEILLDFAPGTVLNSINEFYTNTVMNTNSSLYKLVDYDKEAVENFEFFMKGSFSPYHGAGQGCKDYIDFIQKNNAYIRFNHLSEKFEAYSSKFAEEYRRNSQFKGKLWEKQLQDFTLKNGIQYVPPIRDQDETIDLEKLDKYLAEVVNKNFLNYNYGQNELLETLRKMLFLDEKCRYKKINTVLRNLGRSYEVTPTQPERKKRGYKLIEIKGSK